MRSARLSAACAMLSLCLKKIKKKNKNKSNAISLPELDYHPDEPLFNHRAGCGEQVRLPAGPLLLHPITSLHPRSSPRGGGARSCPPLRLRRDAGWETPHGVVKPFGLGWDSLILPWLFQPAPRRQRRVCIRVGNSCYLGIVLQPLPGRTIGALLLRGGKPGRTSPATRRKGSDIFCP